MAAFSQKDREDGEEGMKASREGTPIWLRSPQGWEEGKREKGDGPEVRARQYGCDLTEGKGRWGREGKSLK